MRIAAPQARLAMRFVRVGVTPELASTQILARIVRLGHALELMLSGRIISGEEAGRIGLVNRVVEADKLLDDAIATAGEMAFSPTDSLYAIKRMAWESLSEGDITEVARRENREFVRAQRRPHFKEAVTAFREKRDPDFHKDGD